jgi:serine/threonine protein kinase
MQLLGKSLETIFEEKKKFSLKTVCMLGYQFVSALEYIHNRHILHRDIKPDNFVMGLNNLSQYVYILDFGLAKKYRSSTTLKQLPLVNRKKLTGTARYASINALKGYEHSRRDDLEAVGYVLVYFLKGRLPWQGFTAKNKEERYRKILKKKMEVTPRELCEDLPEEFEHYITYTRNMEYLEEPDYEMLRGLFNSVLIKDHSKFDYIYDWTTPEEKLMRRVITPKSELESYQNKKTTYASFKHFYDSREENYNDKSIYLTLENSKKNLINKYNNNTNGNRENKENNDNIIKKCKKNKQPQPEGSEEPIIISKRKGYLETLSNEEDDVICCSSGCNVF